MGRLLPATTGTPTACWCRQESKAVVVAPSRKASIPTILDSVREITLAETVLARRTCFFPQTGGVATADACNVPDPSVETAEDVVELAGKK